MSNITGTDGSDSLTDTFRNDTISGLGGDDFLYSNNGGSDHLLGGGGNDYLWVIRGGGVTGTVTLEGDSGNDHFSAVGESTRVVAVGGQGSDSFSITWVASLELKAGSGNDYIFLDYMVGNNVISLGGGEDTPALGQFFNFLSWNRVTVKDFTPGDSGDILDFTGFLANHGWDTGANPFETGYLRLVQNGDRVILETDVSGTGATWQSLVSFNHTHLNDFTAHNFEDFDISGQQAPVAHAAGLVV